MLIALFTYLLLGGSSTSTLEYISETRDAVEIVLPKGDEKKTALSTLKAMKKRTNSHNKVAKKTAKTLDKAFGNHDTTADDLDAIWAEYFVEVNKHNDDMLDLRFELKKGISRDEWAAIFQDAE
jgi:hypothetical protein